MVKFGVDSSIRHKLAFAAVCAAVNVSGRFISGSFELPFWLDTGGTCLCAFVLGPWYAVLTGIISNLVIGIYDFLSVLYCIINAGIGLIVGFAAKKKMCTDIFSMLCLSIVTGCFSFLCAVPLNCIFNGGLTGNKWGDALFDMLEHYRISVPLRSICGQALIDIPDKVITLTAVFFIVIFFKKQGLICTVNEKSDTNHD